MKRRKTLGVFITLLLVFTLVLPYTYVRAEDAVHVVVKPTLRSSLTEYDITFVTKADLIGGKDKIFIQFPEETKLPCSCPHNWELEFFSINGYRPARVGKMLNVSNAIYLTIPGGVIIKAGSTVNVVLKPQSNIWNPSKPGKYRLTVWTTRQGKMKSNFYEITSTHLQDVSVSVTPKTAGLVAEYGIDFTTGDLGNLNNGQKIYVKFPEGTKFPDTLNKSSILINGFNPEKVELDGTTLALTLKHSINKDRKCKLIIKGSFGITNPLLGGTYSLYIWTDNEPEKVASEFTLTQKFTVSTHIDTIPEAPDGTNGYFKTIPLVTLKGETNLNNATVKTFYKIDEGKFSEYTAPFKMPEGVHTLYYYSSADELTEKVKSMVFKVDATAPVLTILSPDKNPYATGLPAVKISGKTNEDCAIYINGKPVIEKKDFSFSKEVRLIPGENNITVSAVDVAGNTAKINLKISYDTTVPQIVITMPADWEEITTKEITVKGTVSPASSILYINKEQVSVSENGSFIYSFTPNANVQILPIKLCAVYPVSGKSAEKTITVIYKPQMKKVLLTIGKKTAIVNKSKKQMDVAPFIDRKTNRTLVPVRFVVEFLGGTVQWDAKTRTVTIELNGKTIELTINSTTAYVNGVPYTLDQPPIIRGNRTFIPLRFVVEALGFNVQWNGKTHTITIQTP